MNILSIDIGGTYSRAALFNGDCADTLQQHSSTPVKVSTAAFASFNALMQHLVQQFPASALQEATFVVAVPGPVEQQKYALLANVAWREADVQQLSGIPGDILLINDFVAQAFACLTRQMQAKEIKSGTRHDRISGICVVGAGTGLGHAALQKIGKHYQVLPSEAGHAAFAFDASEMDYQQFVQAQQSAADQYAVNDQIVSGSGLLWLHQFLTGETISAAEIPAKILPDSPTAHYFARLYARSCRNYALSLLDTCGALYITGGVALNSPFLVDNAVFSQEFVHSSAKGSILQTIAIRLNQSDFMGLWGGALYGILHRQGQLLL